LVFVCLVWFFVAMVVTDLMTYRSFHHLLVMFFLSVLYFVFLNLKHQQKINLSLNLYQFGTGIQLLSSELLVTQIWRNCY